MCVCVWMWNIHNYKYQCVVMWYATEYQDVKIAAPSSLVCYIRQSTSLCVSYIHSYASTRVIQQILHHYAVHTTSYWKDWTTISQYSNTSISLYITNTPEVSMSSISGLTKLALCFCLFLFITIR